MSETTTRHIAVIGTGLIGSSWATLFLARGFDVVAYDPAEGAEQRLRETVARFWPGAQRLGLSEGASADRLRFASNVADAVRGSAFIQESGPEDLRLKRALLAEIEADAPADTIIATSSSGLIVSGLQSSAVRPGRVLLGHPFNPPHIIPLVEVIGGKQTDEEAIEEAISFYRSIGKTPVRINSEVPGHVANRLQVAVWTEAIALVREGVISVEDLDTVMSFGPGLRWALLGPFANLHAGGGDGGIRHMLEHLGPAMRQWSNDLSPFPETDDYIEDIASAVEASLAGQDFAAVVRARDELLLQLLADKAARDEPQFSPSPTMTTEGPRA